MYIVTAFALNYSTQNLGLPRAVPQHPGLLVGGLSCLTIPASRLADRFGRRRIYITGALIGTLSGFPFFYGAGESVRFWILFFALMLANIALMIWWSASSSRYFTRAVRRQLSL